MKHRVAVMIGICALAAPISAFAALQEEAIQVEPGDLAKRKDLVGKKVAVDDHKAFYVARPGDEPDELQLKRTTVTFLVPRKMRPADTAKVTAVLVEGVLRREGSRLLCDVTELKPVAGDLERLENGVKSLGPRDFETRKAWATWAERRARDFKNNALMERARELEAEAFRIETALKRLGVDAPREWLALAKDARSRKVPEPEPAALAHKAFRAQLAATPDIETLQTIIKEIEQFFPDSATDRDAARTPLARRDEHYAVDPAAAYRQAPEKVRKAFDRRLWADASEQLISLQRSPDVAAALARASEAATLLPEKPDLAARLIEKGVAQARQNLGALRQAELKELAKVLREKLKRPEEALAVTREWLEIRKNRLRDTDAEGPVTLAVLYEEMLGDTVTSIELLRKAWRIDPNSKEIEEAFRIRGYRKVQNEWVLAGPGPEGPGNPAARPEVGRSRSLTGMTAEEARQKLGGKPNQVNYLGSKGQLIEQWIYLDTQGVRYVNILHSRDDVKPRVVAFYTLPLTKVKGGLDQKR